MIELIIGAIVGVFLAFVAGDWRGQRKGRKQEAQRRNEADRKAAEKVRDNARNADHTDNYDDAVERLRESRRWRDGI